MSDRQLLDIQQSKVKDQNKEIDEIIGNVKRGNEMTKETRGELLKQNLLLDNLDKDVIDFNLDGCC